MKYFFLYLKLSYAVIWVAQVCYFSYLAIGIVLLQNNINFHKYFSFSTMKNFNCNTVTVNCCSLLLHCKYWSPTEAQQVLYFHICTTRSSIELLKKYKDFLYKKKNS